ncbi:MAG: M14 family metallopeptidase, partial [Bacteroidota bacterium]
TQLWRFLAIFLLILSVPIQNYLTAQESPPIYAKVVVQLADELSVEQLVSSGVDLDHFHPVFGDNTLILPLNELPILQDIGLPYTVVSNDWASDIEARNAEDLAKYEVNPAEKTTQGFELGSMGGFYTLAEIVQQLDEMASLYPNLITSKFSIGTTFEGRDIWAVKISDNPGTDESSTEAQVYFDALHHAREPASGSTVINFMFYLLENYGTDPQITYLLDNREIHIVACVNPDGYEYNRLTNPGGGGLWRKNRRPNAGSSCVGVDLNRNYDTDWGGAGSSGNPCSDSYRGPSVFSELESQAVRDFVTNINPPIAYTTHTFGEYWLGPDFSNGQTEFAIHAELNSDCLDENEYIYGDADLLLGYVSGTTQNWIYEAVGSLTWTPEIGTSFWPSISEIIPLINNQIKPFEYAVWVAGALADYQGFTVLNSQGLSSGQNLELAIEIKNKGLSQTANSVNVTLTSDNAGVTAVTGALSYGNIASRASLINTVPFEFSVNSSVPVGTLVKFYADVTQDGVLSDRDSFYITVGEQAILFSDGAESGTGNWSNSGSGTTWQTSDEDAYQGNNCFVDSRLGHTAANNSRSFSMASSVSLAGTSNPRLEFAAKWGLHTGTDYVRLQVSTNGGSSWSNVTTPAMETVNGGPAFRENERWTFQSVSLASLIGQSVRFRFVS